MIVKRELGWLRMLFSVRGSALSRTMPRIAVITTFSILVTAAELYFDIESYSLTLAPFTVVGLAIGIFLGFRNNAAYDRYWEGRKLWGQMVNSSRSFARQILVLLTVPADNAGGDEEDVRSAQRDLVRRMIAYVHALRCHLRGTAPFEELLRFLPGSEVATLQAEQNVPNAILLQIGRRLRHFWRNGSINDYHLAVLEGTLTSITDVQGGCERIKNTPIPFAYTVLTHRTVAFYCFALPFGLIKTIGALTPVVVLLVSYAFLGLDEVGDQIEDPFGNGPQDLPLTSICRTIEINLLQAIEADHVPEMLQPVAGVLE